MTYDDMLEKYSKHIEILNSHRGWLEQGIIPHNNIEGAPEDIETAWAIVDAMAFVAGEIVNDLLAMKMELVFEEASQQEESLTQTE